jgi:polyisoprenoid-binding protein YceI
MFAATLVLTMSAVAFAAVQKFTPDENHTRLLFVASTLLFDVDGSFGRYTFDIEGDPDNLSGVKINVEIDAASINTQNERRDTHLKSADFFNVAQYPKITFTSTRAVSENGKVVVDGVLSMHGHQKNIRIPFSKVTAANGAGNMETLFKGEITLNRNDFGIGADSVAAKISLENDVKVKLVIAGFFKPKAS